MSVTLASIGFNLLYCSTVTIFSVVWFGLAVRLRRFNDLFAPRTWGRPTGVLQNVLNGNLSAANEKKKRQTVDTQTDEGVSNPYRNESDKDIKDDNWWSLKESFVFYSLAWIPWTYSLTHREMVEGIPGTGTRAGGRSGNLLSTNLDGIILIRFQEMCLRICSVATFLFCCILLPLYVGSGCNSDAFKDSDPRCLNIGNLTDFGRTTLSHIPNLNPSENIFQTAADESSLLAQHILVVVVAWILCAYVCAQLWKEWVGNLALRRVFYFEQDHWRMRKNEIKRQLSLVDEEEHFQRLRPPWVPHPELRETVPNVAVQTVLCELPEKPKDIEADAMSEATSQDPEKNKKTYYGSKFATKNEWQIAEATKFFDNCIPNQPGYSSSVAAVTILPETTLLAKTWERWIVAGRFVRRTRFIKQLIAEQLIRLREDDELDEDSEVIREALEVGLPIGNPRLGTVPYNISDYGPYARESSTPGPSEIIGRTKPQSGKLTNGHTETIGLNRLTPDRLEHRNFDKSLLGYSQLFGTTQPGSKIQGPESESEFEGFLDDLGIEQTAAYSRAFAESGAGICPRGCRTGKLRRADMQQLLVELRDAEEASVRAHQNLLEARDDVNRFAKGEGELFGVASYDGKDSLSPLNLPVSGDSDDEENNLVVSNLPGVSISLDSRYRSASGKQWKQVSNIINDSQRTRSDSRNDVTSRRRKYCMARLVRHISQSLQQMTCYFGKAIINAPRRPTYAAITFTSRQAAAAARQCLADGSGLRRWEQQSEIPVPPLADSPAGTLFTTYGWCRPVTVAISDGEKLARRFIAWIALVTIYFFYTIPLSYAQSIFSPEYLVGDSTALSSSMPDTLVNARSSGFLAGGIQSLFLFSAPFLFLAIANFGSGAISIRQAEFIATKYYWWFILLTAFTGSSLTTMIVNGFDSGFNISSEFQQLIVSVATVLPTQISATWISWIVIQSTVTFPLGYFCFIGTFIIDCCRIKYFSRLIRGFGPGGPVPFRVFVDAGTVILCVLALAPTCPLVAPIGLLYFLITTPILKWGLIFVYRPYFDDGGRRWPQIFHIMVSALILSQILLTATMGLKQAVIPAVMSGLTILPTLFFSSVAWRQFGRAYNDCGLLQTAELDGWDTSRSSSFRSREDYRTWLVDCHKASYIPACLVGSDIVLTAEPSVTIPLEHDAELKNKTLQGRRSQQLSASSLQTIREKLLSPKLNVSNEQLPWSAPNRRNSIQRGVLLRRVSRGLIRAESMLSSSARIIEHNSLLESVSPYEDE